MADAPGRGGGLLSTLSILWSLWGWRGEAGGDVEGWMCDPSEGVRLG